VRYEDLVTDTKSVVRRICDFLDEPYLDCLIEADGTSTKPRHDGWRYAERGPVSTDSIGQFAREMTAEQRTLFGRVRVSAYGMELLYKPAGITQVPSPVELQEMLGYSTEGLDGSETLECRQIQAAWDDFEQYRWQMRFRHGVDLACPIALDGIGIKRPQHNDGAAPENGGTCRG
jgi:hypothetical protein